MVIRTQTALRHGAQRKDPHAGMSFRFLAHRGNSAPTPQELPNDDWLLRSRAGPLADLQEQRDQFALATGVSVLAKTDFN